ncbi:hypothetical protein DUNSADRAFT_15996 [Dunaliella salina]|uniref:Uncharacterized protein n=1 Tax=Dunaliella salina TaxID=3046 RepID=A0ABQ7G4F4_DUNSA|nr:hypothetical protein DUNSADRAFT_15996 [Dunaliella salina]KAF5829486.1 hypothetical protein DUNSADRAFT_15996 [Dunaliella salina]KAF5829487.1 hypothetical protein DUNSADRAFT_15996 [Dunaliella salina]|eukprot:KAF5829485.1 hypothetical protein DUNSADRAFT_15996 [Dunaliella salina]
MSSSSQVQEPSKRVEERLLSVLKEFQEQQVQRHTQHQRPRHQRSSSLFARSPASDSQRSASSCKPPSSQSGSLLPPSCALHSAGPCPAPSTLSAPNIPTTSSTNGSIAAPVPATNHALPNSHALGRVRLSSHLSRSSGHARSILTGSNDGIAHDSMLVHAPSDSSSLLMGNTHSSRLGAMSNDTSILSGAKSTYLARLPAHSPRSSSATLAHKGLGDASGTAGRQPSTSIHTSTAAEDASSTRDGSAPISGSGSPRSPHQRAPSLLLQQLHVRTPTLGNISNSSMANGLHGLAGKGSALDSTLSSPRKAAPHPSDTVSPTNTHAEGSSEAIPQPSLHATGQVSWAPWLTANTSTLPVPQPPPPTAQAPQQYQHRKALSTCAALLTGVWDEPAVQQLDQQQHRPQAQVQHEGQVPQPQLQQHVLMQHQDLSQQQQQQQQQEQQQQQQSACQISQPQQLTQQALGARVHHQELCQQQHFQPSRRGSSGAATTVYHDSWQPPSHKEQQEGLFGLLHTAATAAAAAAAAHEQQQQQQQQLQSKLQASTSTSSSLPSAAPSEPALSPSTSQQQQEQKREREGQLQLQQQLQQQQEQEEQEWQNLLRQQEQQQRLEQQLEQEQQQQESRLKRASPFCSAPSTPPPRLATPPPRLSTPPPITPESSSQVTTPKRPAHNRAHTLHSAPLGPEARSPLRGAQQHVRAQGSPHSRSAAHIPYRPKALTPVTYEHGELSSPVPPGPIPADSPTHLSRRTSGSYSSHPTHASAGSLGQRSVQQGGVDVSSPSILHHHLPHSHAGGSSSRPHSRRTTSTSGVGSLYGREEGEVRRSSRDARDRRYYTSSDEHPMGHLHHSRSSTSMASMPSSAGGAPSTASSRMATNAATQRHRVPAAPVGTTVAVAAVTGRPNSEATTTPITSTAAMMGGFNAISHARVRSIDLATDMLLGGGRSGRSNSEHSSHGSRLQHHSSHTQH